MYFGSFLTLLSMENGSDVGGWERMSLSFVFMEVLGQARYARVITK